MLLRIFFAPFPQAPSPLPPLRGTLSRWRERGYGNSPLPLAGEGPGERALRCIALLVLFALLALPALAHEGHDDDAPAATGVALPRFAAASDLFELVGVVNGTHVALYLDRYEDNAPVAGARVELDIGSAKVPVREVAKGEFEGTLAAALPEGVTAVTAVIEAGNDSDLLAAELDIHAPHEDGPGEVAAPSNLQGWLLRSVAALAVFAALAGLISAVGKLRRKGATQNAAQGGAA